jgi:hypothetical protein
MTRDEAKQEAIKRWGSDAIATPNFQMTLNCEVSDGMRPPRFWGIGSTWEEAFEDAEERFV